MFWFNKIRTLRLDLQRCKLDLKMQQERYGHLLRENVTLAEKLRNSNLEVLSCKRKLKFPPAFQEGQTVGNIEILEITEFTPNAPSSWASAISGIASIALFVASASLLLEPMPEMNTKPKYRYRIYDQTDNSERDVTEKEFRMIVAHQR